MSSNKCNAIQQQYNSTIEDIVNIQRTKFKEAIFFIYEDGSTSDIYTGKETSISLTQAQQKRVINNGNLVSSVHTHPTGLDLSTIDIMTGLITKQENMCIAVPVEDNKPGENYVLTCMDMSGMGEIEKAALFRAMRRSSVGVSNLGRLVRKELNLKIVNVNKCRSASIG